MFDWLAGAAQAVVDGWMAVVPRKRPDPSAIENCRIVAHRGAHDRSAAHENTLAAFERAKAAGVWGIETDIRWTADLVPVIIHDPDTRRVFGKPVTIADVTFAQLRKAVPEVPSLAELLDRFGRDTHLMLELKAEPLPQLEQQKRILAQHLSSLKPHDDYHVLSLDPALFETFDIRPRDCCLTVATTNMRSLSETTLGSGYGGITGHFLLLTRAIQRKHERIGQKVGTGFIRSRYCLYREINRGMDWIFTNDAVKLQRIVDELKAG